MMVLHVTGFLLPNSSSSFYTQTHKLKNPGRTPLADYHLCESRYPGVPTLFFYNQITGPDNIEL